MKFRMKLPRIIYLQCYDYAGELLNLVRDNVTWCVDQINENDAVYVLARARQAATGGGDEMTIDLNAIKARCKALDERMGDGPWTLERSIPYVGLFSVYDSDGNVISHDVEEVQSFIYHSHADVPALVAEVERLQRELHDEQVRRDEWEKMYNQAIRTEEEPV